MVEGAGSAFDCIPANFDALEVIARIWWNWKGVFHHEESFYDGYCCMSAQTINSEFYYQ